MSVKVIHLSMIGPWADPPAQAAVRRPSIARSRTPASSLGGASRLDGSGQGVAVAPRWDAWRARSFAWARHLA